MPAYLLRRIAMTIPTLLLVSIAVFTLMRLIPGDPVLLMLGEGADPAQLALMRHQMGLDQPLPAQYLVWLKHALAGDLGASTTNGLPVLPLIWERFHVSAVIVLVAVALASLIAVPAGLVAAWRKDKPTDLAIIGAATLMLSVPSFWLGLLLLMFFGQYLGWLPVVGYVPMSESFSQGVLYVAEGTWRDEHGNEVAAPPELAHAKPSGGGVVDPEGTIEYAAYNVKATGHVAKLRKDLGLDAA